MQGFEVPLAAWQVHATAAHIEEKSGNLDSARSHLGLSRATILQLANSMEQREPLRETFLSAPAVARVLRGWPADQSISNIDSSLRFLAAGGKQD